MIGGSKQRNKLRRGTRVVMAVMVLVMVVKVQRRRRQQIKDGVQHQTNKI
jgi:hypothetical protein